MAIMLGMAALIAQKRDQLENNYVLIFSPQRRADEGRTAYDRRGCARKSQRWTRYTASHIWPYLEAGKIGIKQGPLMAGIEILMWI